MPLERLGSDTVYRWYLASPLAFANPLAPTTAELNANPTNNPEGLIWNLTCAINVDGSQFDLDGPETDESLTFCQTSGDFSVMTRSATVVFNYGEAKQRWTGTTVLPANGFNVANLAKSLLTWRGVDYYAILSVGKSDSAAFAVNDRLKIVEVSTDVAVPEGGTGAPLTWTQTFAKRSGMSWNYKVLA